VGPGQWPGPDAAAFQITKENARSQVATGVYALAGTVRVNGARAQPAASPRLADRRQLHLPGCQGHRRRRGRYLGRQGAGQHAQAHLHHLDHLRPGPHWQVGGGATYMSQRYANATNTVQVGGYTRYDAMLAYTTKAYDIRLNLYNLTDKMYYDALIQSDGGRSVPGSGRTALLSLTYRM
jgi:catecholate siderophore receptor